MLTALLDGDTLLYAASSSCEYEAQWEPWLWTLHADLDEAILKLDTAVSDIQDATGADRCIVALSDERRWRPEVMPTYKGNRKGVRKPVVYKALRQYTHERYTTFQRPLLEGDDVLGILATHPTIVDGEKIVVAIDKDMKQVPGKHYNYDTGELFDVSVQEADYFHLFQTLTGDPTDGYPGCPGVGPVKAEAILGPCHREFSETIPEVWNNIIAAYLKKGLGEEVALMNARVSRILRHDEYNFKTKEVILWTPR